MKPSLPSCVAVVGLGYVGLPLAVALGKVLPTIGFDVDEKRILELQNGYDHRGEMSQEELRVPHLEFTANPAALQRAPFIIIAVPTPVDQHKRPDLSHLVEVSRLVGRNLSPGTIVVYESTVYPGATEEVCLPILSQESGLKAGEGFKVGYSPERINPGDPEHTLEKVVKVAAAQDEETLEIIARVYELVVQAGVHKAPDIKTAEAAKVIENIQRDLNIALMNELAMLFHRMGLNTKEVLKAARTKWNFLSFEPGLVGGHCIPVDPYYLTHKAQEVGYHPEVILAGRRVNDEMGRYVTRETVKLLIRAGKTVKGARVLVLGAAFKEDVRDARNSRVADLICELEDYGIGVWVHDPLVDVTRLGLQDASNPFEGEERYDAVILAVPHRGFRKRCVDDYLRLLDKEGNLGIVVDIKGVLSMLTIEHSGVLYWSL